MRQNRDLAMKWIGLSEGGFVHHPKDPGGATDRGITQRTFDAWNRQHGRATRTVKGISKAEAEQIISSQYFDPVKFDALPSGLDYATADYSVNSGPARAVKELQQIVGVTADGIAGSQTLAAVAERSKTGDQVAALVETLCQRRMAFLRGLPHWSTFATGWTRRVMGNRDGAQPGADNGVIDRGVKLARGIASANTTVSPSGNAKAPEAAPGFWQLLAEAFRALVAAFTKGK